jgi:hypothetical protein
VGLLFGIHAGKFLAFCFSALSAIVYLFRPYHKYGCDIEATED